MTTRRRALGIFVAAGAGILLGARARAALDLPPRVYAPSLQSYVPPTLTPTQTTIPTDDAPILGPASGTVAQALAWFAPRANEDYTDFDLQVIIEGYRDIGESVGMDWFLALAQNAHETGSLTSFWSQRPQRNPAGLGVTGSGCDPNNPPAAPNVCAYNYQRARWEIGIAFPGWVSDAIPAHLGRLLAYALTDAQANPAQLALIQQALSYRGLPAWLRGTAPTIIGLNGRWAVPGATYGQSIISLRDRMNGAKALDPAAPPPIPGDQDDDVMPEWA
jgi:hypothetical protein